MPTFGSVQKKILIVLLGGVALGMSRSPRQYYRALRLIKKDWKKVNQYRFNRSIKGLSESKLVEGKRSSDGTFELILTEKGKREAKRFLLMNKSIKIKKLNQWDEKWRIVIFDIPEKDRVFRNILRSHLKELEFLKLQHSVFVSPYPFEELILKLTKLYSAQRYVRIITATKIDNEKTLKKHFFKKSN